MNNQPVFDLLPFLRLQFGGILKPGLESVNLVFTEDYLLLETTERDAYGIRKVSSEPGALALKEGVGAPHEIVLAYLHLDELGWAHVGDIFPVGMAQAIVEALEADEGDPLA